MLCFTLADKLATALVVENIMRPPAPDPLAKPASETLNAAIFSQTQKNKIKYSSQSCTNRNSHLLYEMQELGKLGMTLKVALLLKLDWWWGAIYNFLHALAFVLSIKLRYRWAWAKCAL